MKKIPLTKGLVAIVDEDDYEILSHFKWYSVGHPGKYYAAYYGGKNNGYPQHIRMHRVILNAPNGIEVDHINGDRLDNRRINLRLGSRAENACNRGKFNVITHSRYKGVTFHKRDRIWQGTICTNGNHVHLGYFKSEQEAATAYNIAAITYHGKYAKLNKILGEKNHVK